MKVVAKARSLEADFTLYLSRTADESFEGAEATAKYHAQSHQQNQTVEIQHQSMDLSLRFGHEVTESKS